MFVFRPVARTGYSPVTEMFIFGGSNNSSGDNTIRRYSGTGSFSTVSGVSIAGMDGQAGAALSGVAHLFGYVEIYNFTPYASSYGPINLSESVAYPSAATMGSAIYMFGGSTTVGGNRRNYIQKYDGSSRTAEAATLASNVFGTSCAYLPSASAIYIFGGYGTSAALDTIQKYDGTTRSTETDVLSSAMTYTSSAEVGGNVYVFGGSNGGGSPFTSAIQKFDGTTRTTEAATLAYTLDKTTATTMGSKAYIFAGNDSNTTLRFVTQSYNGTTRSTESATFPSGRKAQASVTLTYSALGFI